MRMALRLLALGVLTAIPGGCASSGHGAKTEVNAVVQDEQARQAATTAAARGEGSKAALDAGAAAANPQTARPPS